MRALAIADTEVKAAGFTGEAPRAKREASAGLPAMSEDCAGSDKLAVSGCQSMGGGDESQRDRQGSFHGMVGTGRRDVEGGFVLPRRPDSFLCVRGGAVRGRIRSGE